MALAKLNKRNKLMWDNAFNPVGGNNYTIGETSADPGTVVGYVNNQEIREKIITKVIGETQMSANHAAFKIEPDTVNVLPLSISGVILPDNEPISSSNVPCYFDGAGSTTSATTFATTNTIRARITSNNNVWVVWGAGNTTIKEGSVVYIKVQYIVLNKE